MNVEQPGKSFMQPMNICLPRLTSYRRQTIPVCQAVNVS